MPDTAPDLADAYAVTALFRGAAEAFRDDPKRRGAAVHLPDRGHLLATGDLHDHALNFRRILKLADLDADPDRHLILHEVIHGPDLVNGCDLSVRTAARCADLKLRHPETFHVLLSNHELAQLRGEGIIKDGVGVVAAFDQGVEYLYGQDADDVRDALHDYLRSLPLAARCANGVMVSHSLPAPRRIEAFDKTVLDRPLTDEDLAPKGSAYDLVWGRHQNKKITEELAEAWGVAAFVVGHQPAETGYEPLADNTLIIASDHGHGVALSIDLSRPYTRPQLVQAVRALAAVSV
ncbi:MAG: metallophosphoesterase [Planctomycetota bacterium]